MCLPGVTLSCTLTSKCVQKGDKDVNLYRKKCTKHAYKNGGCLSLGGRHGHILHKLKGLFSQRKNGFILHCQMEKAE